MLGRARRNKGVRASAASRGAWRSYQRSCLSHGHPMRYPTAVLLTLLLAGCGGEKPAPAAPPGAPKESAETARLRLEVQALSERLADLERRAERPRGVERSGTAPGAITDDVLIALLRSGEDALMRGAAALAKKQPSPRVQEVLIEMAGETRLQTHQRGIALEGLQGQRHAAVIALWIRLLDDPEDILVGNSAKELGQLHNPAHVPLLLEACKNLKLAVNSQRNSTARYALLHALQGAHDPRVLPVALEALKSPHQNIRDQAWSLLASLRSEAAIQEMLNLLSSLPPPEVQTHPHPHLALISGLGAAKESRAAPLFAKLLECDHPGVVEASLGQLQQVCGPEQVPQMLKALAVADRREQAGEKSAVWRMTQIARILGQAGGTPAALALLELTERTHQPSLAQEAVTALARAAPAELTEDLIAAHGRAPPGPLKQGLEGILRNGKFTVRWVEAEGRFTTKPLQVELETPPQKTP